MLQFHRRSIAGVLALAKAFRVVVAHQVVPCDDNVTAVEPGTDAVDQVLEDTFQILQPTKKIILDVLERVTCAVDERSFKQLHVGAVEDDNNNPADVQDDDDGTSAPLLENESRAHTARAERRPSSDVDDAQHEKQSDDDFAM